MFAGGWTLEAAEALGSGEGVGNGEVLDPLSRLVDKSLVALEEGEHDGALRYTMLEPVRQYAREKLRESGEEDAVQERHAGFYLALAEEAEPEMSGPNQEAWLKSWRGSTPICEVPLLGRWIRRKVGNRGSTVRSWG